MASLFSNIDRDPTGFDGALQRLLKAWPNARVAETCPELWLVRLRTPVATRRDLTNAHGMGWTLHSIFPASATSVIVVLHIPAGA